jgi:putative SOS response-associated peptidase YedK
VALTDCGINVSARSVAAADTTSQPASAHCPAKTRRSHRPAPFERKPHGEHGRAPALFALNDDRPLFVFAGIWTTFNGDRGTKSKPGPHQVYGFLTTSPNAVVEPIHPKARC